MRLFLLVVFALGLYPMSAQAAGIQTGRDLVTSCSDYMAIASGQDNNAARRPHPCRSFLQGYFVSLIEREDARQNALIRGLAYASKEQCVRVPDFLSYREMAGRVLNFAQGNPASLNGPAATMAQRTMERDFPCPPPRLRPR